MIRPLTVDDLEEYIRVRIESLRLNPEAFGAAHEEGVDRAQTKINLAQKNEENFILGYFDSDKLVGMVVFMRNQRLKLKHKGSIFGMYVDPTYRGKGLGKILMEACLAKASLIEGLESIHLSVSDRAKTAQQLYTKMGFKQWGIERNSLKLGQDYLDEIFMSKSLV